MSQDPAEAKQAEQVVITLSTGSHEKPHVIAVDLTVNGMRVCLHALQARTVRAVFRSEVSGLIDQITSLVSGDCTAARVLGPSLRCGTVNIIGYSFDGKQQAECGALTVRLFYTEGNALSLFREIAQPGAVSLSQTGSGDCERLFEQMVNQLYLPLADLNMFLSQPVPSRDQDHAVHLTNTVVQFKTRAERLKRAFDRLITQVRTDKLAAG